MVAYSSAKLCTLNIKPADNHHQLYEVHGDDAISDGMVRRWVRKFNEGRVSVHDEQRTGRTSLINVDLVRAVDEKIMRTGTN
ncbi:hypothetical protein ANN_18324 [Periplaneta americana]|uniref:Mos1 transposase HTH domain-containing protein n=1 Tax=Periplaneta americana TaxID=6978 RepID=A0ABQ8SP27_PERAM|nr:hypothetical protein ANN_18324 [Periplaneta americana]